jgi:uncharacterized SAM-binding protein YcdF (DUF218 family)
MKAVPSTQRVRLHALLRLLAIVAVVLLLWFSEVCVRIVRQARTDEVRPAAAIVVFGAAEYSGRPSPIYRARLDHAFELFRQDVASLVITTGGSGRDPSYTEGGVGRDYLLARGVPERSLIAETQSSNTAQSAVRVATIMKKNGLRSCVSVSDAYHVFRVKRMLEQEGVTAYGAPRPDSRPRSAWQCAVAVAREALSYMLWRLRVT